MTPEQLRDWIAKDRPRLERSLARHLEMIASDNAEIRMGAQAFAAKYERELAILAYAERGLEPRWNTDLSAAPRDEELEVLMPKVWCNLNANVGDDDRTEHVAYVRVCVGFLQGVDHWQVPELDGEPSGEWLGEDVEWADNPLAWRLLPPVPPEIAALIKKTNPTEDAA